MRLLNWLRGGDEVRSASWDTGDLFSAGNSSGGQVVNDETALSVMAVFAAVRIISEGMASLPLDATKPNANGFTEPMKNQPAWLTIPNAPLNITIQDLVSQMLVSLLLRGNAYVFVLRDGLNRVVGLEVLDPDSVSVRRVADRLVYDISGVPFDGNDVLHVRGLTLPGAIEGLDPLTHAAATIGTGLASQDYGNSYFENASLPSGFITVPGSLSEAAAGLMKKSWDKAHSGAENAGKAAVLTEGAEFKPLSLSPEQTQFLEVRRFTVQDVARLFGVPPHLLADSSNSTSWGSGLAEQNTAFSKMTLTPWAERVEVGLTRVLRSEGGPRQNTQARVRINLDGFERGSYADRIDTYASGIAAGIYDPNEVRGWEDLPPLEPAPIPEPVAAPADPEPESEPVEGETNE